MAEVAVRIAGREYRLACEDGEEAGLTAYAARMDEIADTIQKRMNTSVSEGSLLVMIGMILADELANAEAQTAGDASDPNAGKEIAARITAVTDRIERLSRDLA